MTEPARLGFVCVQNAGRSQMATAFAEREREQRGLEDSVEIVTGGTDPADAVHDIVVEVEARGTTKECAECGVETAKPLWVREHSCPSCGFELDRDWNAALNVQQRGWNRLGVVHSEATPAETATAVDTLAVSASRVVETGSPCLKEAAQAAE